MKPSPPLRSKLGIGDDTVFTVLHAPADFAARLGNVGTAVWQQSLLAPIDMVLTFQRTAAALRAEWPRLADAAQPDGAVWVAFPSSGELDAATVRAGAPAGWSSDKACSIDATWSALRFVFSPPRLRPRDAAQARRR